jgi:hypothetical protein
VGNVATASPTEQEATWAEIEAAGGLVAAAAGATTIEIV